MENTSLNCSSIITSRGYRSPHVETAFKCCLRTLPINDRCLQSHCLTMGLNSTILCNGSPLIINILIIFKMAVRFFHLMKNVIALLELLLLLSKRQKLP